MPDGRAVHLPAARGFSRKRRPDVSLPLTGPVTFTFVSTLAASTTRSSTALAPSASRLSTTNSFQSSAVPVITSISASSTRVSTSSASSSSSSSSLFSSSTTSRTTADFIPSAVVSSPVAADSPQLSPAPSTKSLGGGAVAAISIGVLILVAAAAVLVGRRYMARRRQQRRATSRWLSGFTASSSKADPSLASNQPPMSVVSPSYGDGYAYSGTLAASRGLEPVAAPPTSYSNIPVTAGLSPPTITTFNQATVRCTFVPNLPDELSIVNGEELDVLQEYDDGWAFCSNSRGERGMVPVECLASGSDGGSDFFGDRSLSSSRRVSSVSGAPRF
ncbi:hypothetical protein D9757_002921 [Collybiopsis confluens]|uniref:SH3 domain-containing protein n=1 Tax=Collybiopsis confluens TaxID=2823264 RepID=A0A8H5MDR6_9AGAR|nr:hypothetical protein D9757_002921 [Collybiopsis confluens]